MLQMLTTRTFKFWVPNSIKENKHTKSYFEIFCQVSFYTNSIPFRCSNKKKLEAIKLTCQKIKKKPLTNSLAIKYIPNEMFISSSVFMKAYFKSYNNAI